MKPLRQSGLSLFAAAGVASVGLAFATPPQEKEPTREETVFFETKIRPTLVKECAPCHGATSQMGGLRFDTREGAAAAIVKGEPEKSPLVKAIRYTGTVKMPPSHRLPAAQIADLEAWVKMGAPWPKSLVKPKAVTPLWSLQPVKAPAVPKGSPHPIDAFIREKLTAKGLKPAPAADRRSLLRRVTYDLTGLPPTAEETDAFLADRRPNAYERVVERLLASPRYGERWARQWLDVARYADTKGYAFGEDRNYPNAYTYRAWVIKALNDDLPYDRFVMAQLAADRLPETQGAERSDLAALGFLTLGRRFLNDTPSIIDDRIDVTMRGLQGFTVACARCHDHKFDPIPTQDYYSLYAVFDSSEERMDPISPPKIRDPWAKNNEQIAEREAAIRDLAFAQTKVLRTKENMGDVKNALQGLREETIPEGDVLRRLTPAFEPTARDRLATLEKERDDLRKNAPPTPEFAMAMADRKDAHDGVVFKRGNPGIHGDPAPRRFLAALSKGERTNWKDGSGRLDLAKAIVDRNNPLTARVFVNRVWQGHFGQGLVRTPSDFGRQGERPTHPELLDWLASKFMTDGWSIKRLHRLIVTSATYRQAAAVPPAADAENRLLSVMNRRRLDLEETRDTLMSAAGRLDTREIGGRSVDLWARPFTGRRAVYGFVERQNLPGIFRTFDFASPDATSARRFYTTVPQQALFFLNSPFAVEAAKGLATRAYVKGATDDAQRIRRLYRLLFSRLPDAEETAAGVAYLRGGPVAAPTSVWSYGFGGYDGKAVAFTPFATYADENYRVKPTFPEEEFGYVTLNARGGHPGRDESHAAIRRWTAPTDLTIDVSGVVKHEQEAGDGVRARIVLAGRTLGEWKAHHGEARAELKTISIRKGETLDFILDPIGGDNSDGFSWAPTIRAGEKTWDSVSGFSPPPPASPSRLALYAQALLMTDEFLFVD